MSDHYSLLSKIHGVSTVKDNTDIYFRKSDLSESDWERFNFELSDILNQELPEECVAGNIEEYANSITNSYKSVIDKFMPLKKLSRKQKQRKEKPWITSGFRKSRDTKFELLSLSKSSKDPYHYANYKKYLNLYTKLKDIARINYYTHLAELYGNNKSKTWQLVNEISKRKRKMKNSVKCVRNKHGKKLDDPTSIANCLNDHFGCR